MKIANAFRSLPPYVLGLVGFLAALGWGLLRLIALLRDAGAWHG